MPGRLELIQGVGKGRGRRVQGKEAYGSGAAGLGALYTHQTRIRGVLHEREKVGFVVV